MSKKIVILNGSPHMSGNTAALIENFSRGAEQAGHSVIRFDLQKMNIHPCIGCCRGGGDEESPCTQKDDMDKIYPAYRAADMVVLASPVYYYAVTGQLKCTIDRLFAVAEGAPQRKNPKKECVLLMAAGSNNFEEAEYWYDHFVANLGWSDKGRVLCGNVGYMGDIEGNPKLEEAYRLGLEV